MSTQKRKDLTSMLRTFATEKTKLRQKKQNEEHRGLKSGNIRKISTKSNVL